MARCEVPDTSVLIAVIRDPDNSGSFERSLAAGRLWLSSVVVAELYAGTRSRADRRFVDQIARIMRRDNRLLVPLHEDWMKAATLIGRYIQLYGSVNPRDHFADALIVVSASRLKGAVVTTNLKHFEGWAELARRARLDVTIIPFKS